MKMGVQFIDVNRWQSQTPYCVYCGENGCKKFWEDVDKELGRWFSNLEILLKCPVCKQVKEFSLVIAISHKLSIHDQEEITYKIDAVICWGKEGCGTMFLPYKLSHIPIVTDTPE